MEIFYTTTNSKKEAEKIAETLVREKLVACVNIIEGMTSIYEWEGELCKDDEYILLMKSKEEKFYAVEERLNQLHSYDTPCLYSWSADKVAAPYHQWLINQLME